MTTPDRMCDDHPGQVWTRCGACRSDALVSGDPSDIVEWIARHQTAELTARIPTRYALATADVPEVVEWIARWEADPSDCPSLLLTGTVGIGKTWQAYGALRAAVTGKQTTSWVATTLADMYASVRPSPGRDSEAEIVRYRDSGLLLLDDLGVEKQSEWVEEVTYRVISHRYDTMRPTIFTTNLAPPQISVKLGERIASRLAETCQVVRMVGADRRREVSA